MNNNYWVKRELKRRELENKELSKAIDIQKNIYKESLRKIDSKVKKYLMKFATENKLSFVEAKKKLTRGELKSLKMSLNDYIKQGESGFITKEMINASRLHHIDKLEALKLEIEIELSKLTNTIEKNSIAILNDVYEDNYYNTIYIKQSLINKYGRIQRLDSQGVKKAIQETWMVDNMSFSTSLWKNNASIINKIYQDLAIGTALGKSPFEVAKVVKRPMESSLYQYARLLQTEATALSSRAERDSYIKDGIEEYQVLATLSEKTCETCGAMDMKIFKTTDMQVGVNAPPFHPNCRCTTIGYYEDADFERYDNISKKNIKSVKYEDWKNKYVK